MTRVLYDEDADLADISRMKPPPLWVTGFRGAHRPRT